MTYELLREKGGIIDWLNQYQIKDYQLIEDTEYSYVVNGNRDVNNIIK